MSTFSGSRKAGAAVSTLYLALVKSTKSSVCITSLVSKGRICSSESEKKVRFHHAQLLLLNPATIPLLGHLKK